MKPANLVTNRNSILIVLLRHTTKIYKVLKGLSLGVKREVELVSLQVWPFLRITIISRNTSVCMKPFFQFHLRFSFLRSLCVL